MNERRWFILSVIVWALFVIYILCNTAEFEIGRHTDPPAVEESGRLPGDDIPAEISCMIPDEVAVAEIIAEEEAENERIESALLARSHVIENCTITFYCNERYPHICGTGDGIAYDGTPVIPWCTCAVDPSVIPIGSTVMLDLGDGYGLRTLVANDVGGAVNGNHLDICVGSHNFALHLGRQTGTVYWCEEDI